MWPAMCWCISKNHFIYVSSTGGAQGIQCQRQCKEETWPPGQVAWSTDLTSAPHMPNLQPEYRLTLPINTTVLPPGSKCVESEVQPPSPPKGLPNSIFIE
jgi:hypothetical protein